MLTVNTNLALTQQVLLEWCNAWKCAHWYWPFAELTLNYIVWESTSMAHRTFCKVLSVHIHA